MHPKELVELDQQLAALHARRQALLDATRQEALSSVKASISLYGFTAVELGFQATAGLETGVSRPKTPAKYADPKNPSKTWAGGKGPKPGWVQEHLSTGGVLEDLLIVKPDAS